jgi:hypothetical protein
VIDIRHDENPLEIRSFAAIRRYAKRELPLKGAKPRGQWKSQGLDSISVPSSPSSQTAATRGKICFAVHSSEVTLRVARSSHKLPRLNTCQCGGFEIRFGLQRGLEVPMPNPKPYWNPIFAGA